MRKYQFKCGAYSLLGPTQSGLPDISSSPIIIRTQVYHIYDMHDNHIFFPLFLRREIIFKYNKNPQEVFFFLLLYNTCHCLCSMGPFCSVQAPVGRCNWNWLSGWNKHSKEIQREFVQPVTCTQGGAPNCRVNMSPVIHLSYITQQQLPLRPILNPTLSDSFLSGMRISFPSGILTVTPNLLLWSHEISEWT